jgi:hypothetical protein
VVRGVVRGLECANKHGSEPTGRDSTKPAGGNESQSIDRCQLEPVRDYNSARGVANIIGLLSVEQHDYIYHRVKHIDKLAGNYFHEIEVIVCENIVDLFLHASTSSNRRVPE